METGLSEVSRGALLLLFDFYRTTIKSFSSIDLEFLCCIQLFYHEVQYLSTDIKFFISVSFGSTKRVGVLVSVMGLAMEARLRRNGK